MIKIRKNKKEMVIPESAYGNFYKGSGWVIVEEKKIINNPEEENLPEEEDVSEEDWDNLEEDIEKPISEMNRVELVEKAKKMGVDISGCSNNKQIREKIKENMV